MTLRRWLKRFVLLLLLAGFALVLFLPYPYHAGGRFTFLPAKTVEIHTQVPGILREILVKEGGVVREGQVLARLDTREQEQQLAMVRAELERAEADLRLLQAGPKPETIKQAEEQLEAANRKLEYTRIEAERNRKLFEQGMIPESEFNLRESAEKVDEADVKVAQAHLELAKTGARPEEIQAAEARCKELQARIDALQQDVELATLVSPIAGQICTPEPAQPIAGDVVTPYLEFKAGEWMDKGDLLTTVQQVSVVHAEIHVPEHDIGEVAIDARVTFKPWSSPIKSFEGRVVSVAPTAVEVDGVKVVRVVSAIPNHDRVLLPEMTGVAKIEGEERIVLLAFTRPIVRFFTVEVWSWFP